MINDETIGVSKDMAQAYKQAEDDFLNNMKYISEVIIFATSVKPNDFEPSAYANKVTNAMQCNKSISDLRVKGIKIIGKLSVFNITGVTSSAVVQC